MRWRKRRKVPKDDLPRCPACGCALTMRTFRYWCPNCRTSEFDKLRRR